MSPVVPKTADKEVPAFTFRPIFIDDMVPRPATDGSVRS
jgi:hypothetical protein